MKVLDASAVLAWLQNEPGRDIVEASLTEGAALGAANWSEVMQKELAAGRDWPQTRSLLLAFGLQIEPVTVSDAEWAANRWRRDGLSLAGRLCLALANRMGATVLTADTAWGTDTPIQQIRPAQDTPDADTDTEAGTETESDAQTEADDDQPNRAS
jgi:PIN domain nuclease of toxin-antitoxin system